MMDRKEWLSLMATSNGARLAALWEAVGLTPDFTMLRQPEIGAVMVRGRAGGTGNAFNLGEMTVTRTSLRLADGTIVHGWCHGRDKTQARTIALVDALMQCHEAEMIETRIIAPLRADRKARHTARAERPAATKVDFFTMARGDE